MKHNLQSAVWEITMACNMQCKHCGSSCEERLPDELSTTEALALCDGLINIGLEYITLSGGEPTTRKDWPLIAKKLNEGGVQVSLITNGWLWDDQLVSIAYESGVNCVGISIDGLQETHDYIRRIGSFNRSIDCLKKVNSAGVDTAVITTINKRNIKELNKMLDLFSDLGVSKWQLQISLPMGNFKEQKRLHLEPHHVDDIIDFAHDNLGREVSIVLADCIGYYDLKSITVQRSRYGSDWYWIGCGAGKRSMGILQNGDITACVSLRSPDFIVGNVKEKDIVDIWNNSSSFSWNREMTKDDLSGLCQKCQYGEICLGGCSNSRFCINGSVYSDNKFCSYHVAISNFKHNLDNLVTCDNYDEFIKKYIDKKQYQLAEILIDHKIKTKNMDMEERIATLEMCAYINFRLGNYRSCRITNEKIIEYDKSNVYAWKGLALAKIKEGNLLDGLRCVFSAEELSSNLTADFYYDVCATVGDAGLHPLMDELHNKAREYPDYNEEKFKELLQK